MSECAGLQALDTTVPPTMTCADQQNSWRVHHQVPLYAPVLSLLWYGSRLLMILLMPNS
jgi:hypothetical protein